MGEITIGPSPIQSILFADRLVKTVAGERFTATSLPGHLLHYVLQGHVLQQCNGRTYELRGGTVLWYHEDEWVTGTVLQAPWEMYSINFIAPTYAPPPYEARLFTSPAPEVLPLFREIVEIACEDEFEPARRVIQLHGRLLQLLEHLSVPSMQTSPEEPLSQLWWELETRVRQDLSRPVSLQQLEKWAGCSAATIARAAQSAVGQPPMRRIKQIRLSLARGLVQRSNLTLSQISERVGYGRPHEFSRDYRKSFGVPPRDDRTPE